MDISTTTFKDLHPASMKYPNKCLGCSRKMEVGEKAWGAGPCRYRARWVFVCNDCYKKTHRRIRTEGAAGDTGDHLADAMRMVYEASTATADEDLMKAFNDIGGMMTPDPDWPDLDAKADGEVEEAPLKPTAWELIKGNPAWRI